MLLGRRPLLLALHGAIHTMDPQTPRVAALAIDRGSGRIVAAGDDDETATLAGPLAETVNLAGRTVLPGFIDAHTHVAHYAQARLNVELRGVSSEEAAPAPLHPPGQQTPRGASTR